MSNVSLTSTKSLRLNEMGLSEMTKEEMINTEGGLFFLVAIAIVAVVGFLGYELGKSTAKE
jgi:hypothetical protein